VVPSRVRAGAQAAHPAVERLRAQGCRRARAYGAYDARGGTSQRALFVIDGDGVIRWSYLSPVDINPGADGILAALEEIQGRTVS
jgi:peroxiredoxin